MLRNFKFCSILPNLSTEIGHIYHYHAAVQRAVESLEWKHEAWIPKGAKARAPQWHGVLANDFWDVHKGIGVRLKMLVANIRPLRKVLRQQEGTVFLEHFELQNLAALVLALVGLKVRCELWLLHRYAYGERHWKTRVYRAVHWLLERKMRVRYLTDSELLARLQSRCFGSKVEVVPIPHTRWTTRQQRSKERLFWWPGGSMREDKGLSIIRRIAGQLEGRLVVAEAGREWFGEGPIYVPTVLSEEEYRQWMAQVHFVLLPYSAQEYAHRTSGIFVEAVCAGAVPLVSRRTWMAYELEKFGLDGLIVDWDKPKWAVDEDRLVKMRETYRVFHSEAGLAAAFLRLQTEG